jgi:ribosomal protein S18 acetylase RimI-like enzyme
MPDFAPETVSLPAGVTARCATLADVETLCHFRSRMFTEMGWSDAKRLADLGVAYAEYLRDTLASGEAAGWIAETVADPGDAAVGEPRAIGGACLVWKRVPPSLRNPDGREAYILGVYVDPVWRRKGVARGLVGAAIVQAREQGAAVVTLHASDEGRLVYQGLGFVDSHEMRLFTEHAPAPAWVPAYDAD